MSIATVYPLVAMLLMSGGCFLVLMSRVPVANLSLQYVNSMNCIGSCGVGAFGGSCMYDLLHKAC